MPIPGFESDLVLRMRPNTEDEKTLARCAVTRASLSPEDEVVLMEHLGL